MPVHPLSVTHVEPSSQGPADIQAIERTGPRGAIDEPVSGGEVAPAGRRAILGGCDRCLRRRPEAALEIMVRSSRRFRDEGRVGKTVLHVGGVGRVSGSEEGKAELEKIVLAALGTLSKQWSVDNPEPCGNAQVVC